MVFGVLFLPCFPLYFEFPPMKNEKRVKALLGGGIWFLLQSEGGYHPRRYFLDP